MTNNLYFDESKKQFLDKSVLIKILNFWILLQEHYYCCYYNFQRK